MLKKISILIIFFIISITPNFSLCNDIENEDFDINSLLENKIEVSSNIDTFPQLNARHAIIIDRASQNVLYEKNSNEKCKMASTTKIMTAIIVIENCKNLNDIVTISKKAARYWWF